MAYLLIMNTNSPISAPDDKKNYFIIYAVISAIVFAELYVLPSIITPYSYADKVHRFIGSFESVMTAFVLFFLISGILIIRDKRTAAREDIQIKSVLFHLLFFFLFLAYAFYLCNAAVLSPLPESNIFIKVARIFNKNIINLTIRFRAVYLFLGALCHASLVSSEFKVKNMLRKYIVSLIIAPIVALFLWRPMSFLGGDSILKTLRYSNRFIWPYLSAFVAKSNYFLLKACGLSESSLTLVPGQDPSLSTGSFGVSIAPFCSGLEGLSLWMMIFGIVLFLDWKKINKKRALFIGVLGMILLSAANIIRIYTLMLVGHFYDPAFAITMFHTYAGIVLYSIVMGLILLLSYRWMLKKPGSTK